MVGWKKMVDNDRMVKGCRRVEYGRMVEMVEW
jgi:hypothetical protein